MQIGLKHYVETFAGNPGVLGDEILPIADVDANGTFDVADVQYTLMYYVNNTVSKKNITWEQLLGGNS